MTRTTTMMALAAALVLGACGNKEEKAGGEQAAAGQQAAAKAGGDHALPGDPEKGKAVYEQYCQSCHGPDGKGNGGTTGADFVGDKSRLAKSNEDLLKSIREGTQGKIGMMPAQKDILSDEQMKDALAYIRKTFGGQ